MTHLLRTPSQRSVALMLLSLLFITTNIRGLSKDPHPSTIYGSPSVYGILLTLPVAGVAVFSLPPITWVVLTIGAILGAFLTLFATWQVLRSPPPKSQPTQPEPSAIPSPTCKNSES